MAPDKNQRRRSSKPATAPTHIATEPFSDDAHVIVYFKRHPDDDPDETCPGRSFLNSCPPAVRAKMRAVLQAVAAAPPKRFSDGGYWEAMHDSMAGWFEIRIDGPKRRHYRLFCRLDYHADEFDKPLLVIVDGRSKPFGSVLSEEDYRSISKLGMEYFKRQPRSIAGSSNGGRTAQCP